MTSEIEPHSIIVSLPRPQKPLPPRKAGSKGRFESFADMVNDAWKEGENPPGFAWVRYSLSAGIPLDVFIEQFNGLSKIERAFGRRVFVHPVRMDHHEIELGDLDHLTNPETGLYEIEVSWRKKRCDGGTHIFFAVESSEEEARRDHSPGLDALNALESLVRITLGAMTVVQTRQTLHVDLGSGVMHGDSPKFWSYGPAELPRIDAHSMNAAIELAKRSGELSPEIAGRLSLGMRWANIAFKHNDLLSFWTAIEILSGRRGQAVYAVFAKAYGASPKKAQELAKNLGLNVICRLRGDLVHDGVPIHIDVQGVSYLNALVHDLVRYVAGLECLKFAQTALGDKQAQDWMRPDCLKNASRRGSGSGSCNKKGSENISV